MKFPSLDLVSSSVNSVSSMFVGRLGGGRFVYLEAAGSGGKGDGA